MEVYIYIYFKMNRWASEFDIMVFFGGGLHVFLTLESSSGSFLKLILKSETRVEAKNK